MCTSISCTRLLSTPHSFLDSPFRLRFPQLEVPLVLTLDPPPAAPPTRFHWSTPVAKQDIWLEERSAGRLQNTRQEHLAPSIFFDQWQGYYSAEIAAFSC
ncbi:unnamed protein product [Ectocarpus sp. 12 AP-2014]